MSSGAKEKARADLLAAAAREFGRVGFQRANIDAISLAAGYAKGTIYNYFPSKEGLFLAVVEEACEQAAESAAAPPPASARERLRATIAAFCYWARDNEAFARVLVRECLMGTPELHEGVTRAEAPLLDEVEKILKEGARRGELRQDVSSEMLALAIAGLTDLALARYWASDGTGPGPDEIPELVLGLLLNGHSEPRGDY